MHEIERKEELVFLQMAMIPELLHALFELTLLYFVHQHGALMQMKCVLLGVFLKINIE